MFRSRFLLTTVVAVAAALAAPATSQATFAIKVDVFNVTVDGSGNFTQGAQVGTSIIVADEGGVGTSTLFGSPSNDVESTFTAGDPGLLDYGRHLINNSTTSRLTLSFSSNSNAPVGNPNNLWQTITRMTNTTGTNYRVVLTLGDIFTSVGGQEAGTFALWTTADVNQNGVSGGSKVTVGSKAIYDGSNVATDGTVTFTGPINPAQTQSTTPTYFTRATGTTELYSTLTFDVLSGGSAEVSSQSMIAAPAPAGLIMLAGALPFAGLLRLRRRAQTAAPATAA